MRYNRWTGVCVTAIAVLGSMRLLLSDWEQLSGWEQLISVLIVVLGMLAVVLLLLGERQARQRTTEEKRRQRENALKGQISQFRDNARVFWVGLESVFGADFSARYQDPAHRPNIEAGIRQNVVGSHSQLSDPLEFRHAVSRMSDVLQEWDEDADSCRAAGKRLASTHATTLSLLEVAATELANRDGLSGDHSFIGRVRETWHAGLSRRS